MNSNRIIKAIVFLVAAIFVVLGATFFMLNDQFRPSHPLAQQIVATNPYWDQSKGRGTQDVTALFKETNKDDLPIKLKAAGFVCDSAGDCRLKAGVSFPCDREIAIDATYGHDNLVVTAEARFFLICL